ncbi:hypothetical protein TI39_contig4202g00044 [Zymoseptoria brevis]|uniref:Uncharacterized protein n=1 Tax=Zymoseptoria brevis TaxID=1047168 RepID=A0A0F4GA89_9PEZI|nr:hypothetical protein TI39_contig4202g00044 [Zymoseptoria brevis]
MAEFTITSTGKKNYVTSLPKELLFQITTDIFPNFIEIHTNGIYHRTSIQSIIDADSFARLECVEDFARASPVLAEAVLQILHDVFFINRIRLRVELTRYWDPPVPTGVMNMSAFFLLLRRFQVLEIKDMPLAFVHVPKDGENVLGHSVKSLSITVERAGSTWRLKGIVVETVRKLDQYDERVLELAELEDDLVAELVPSVGGALMGLHAMPPHGHDLLSTMRQRIAEASARMPEHEEWKMMNPHFDWVNGVNRPVVEVSRKLGWVGKAPLSFCALSSGSQQEGASGQEVKPSG